MDTDVTRGVVLGVTGGIAAYKAAGLASMLIAQGMSVRVVMTENAAKFVAPLTFETLTGGPVHVGQFSPRASMEHISLARFARVLLVAPATANFIGKYASGIADDLLTTTALTVSCPVVIAPAMNGAMWRHPAVQENVRRLRGRGVEIVGPVEGRLACGDVDVGRLAPEGEIAQVVVKILEKG
ncbi:MAG TPA: hypothetical protein ENN09_04035 [Planctomycetes bacterium]|nr:hypothetical protein [Planctomycetota bacterium]